MNTLTPNLASHRVQPRCNVFRFPRSLLFAGLIALSLGCLDVRAEEPAAPPKLPLPAKYETFRTALNTVLSSGKVPEAEKAQLNAWAKPIEKAFRAEWKPTVALFEKSQEQLARLGDKVEEHNAEAKALVAEHDSIDTTDYNAVVAYNARADAANARKASYDAEKDAVLQKWDQHCAELEAALDASAMASFVEHAKQTLRNHYGEAYQQLLGIHEGALDWDGR